MFDEDTQTITLTVKELREILRQAVMTPATECARAVDAIPSYVERIWGICRRKE